MKSKPHSVTELADCTCANLRKAARIVTQAYDFALQPSGLKSTQFILLANLVEQGDMPLTQLAEALVMDRTTLTRNLKPLLRQGLIRIEQEEDLRVRKVSLTGDGLRSVEDARPLWEEIQARIGERLGDDRWSGLIDDLGATVEAFQES
ncbi:MarR family winged helix-turn-helix transcriptional regulator [Denitrobaculum tricleocarpae]|uniref:Winged helix-turn-helix transcriptional regulator n=1 Tax=Denitrobaculum tricleocarpae TaxID=2591009 RepID=A0A545U2J0_9PROT|nr:MarR family winged helix-turn-helix transcriptional regulator [Denitrobaculum tricleocarpae]TQV83690.1 winged helix-turn-helix transcriptional regulator [Denitrobaculum tricleocarpae]